MSLLWMSMSTAKMWGFRYYKNKNNNQQSLPSQKRGRTGIVDWREERENGNGKEEIINIFKITCHTKNRKTCADPAL